MNRNLLILGAGQYGRLVKETAVALNCFEKICFLDDNSPLAIDKLDAYAAYGSEFCCAFVAMGNPKHRIEWLYKLDQAGFELPSLIHPKAYVSPSASLGKGIIVEPMCVVNSEAIVGDGCLLCAGCVVNHNAQLMSCCQVDCNATVESNAIVPEETKVVNGTVFKRD